MYRKLLLASALCLIAFVSANDATAAKVGEFCGGFAGVKCDKGLWCQLRNGTCGFADAGGTCAAVPKFCPHLVHYVCGCNKKTYINDCDRERHQVSKAHDGKC
jgi:hypothetical protein